MPYLSRSSLPDESSAGLVGTAIGSQAQAFDVRVCGGPVLARVVALDLADLDGRHGGCGFATGRLFLRMEMQVEVSGWAVDVEKRSETTQCECKLSGGQIWSMVGADGVAGARCLV